MFKRLNQEELLRRPKETNSGNLNKLRILQSIPLKKINDSLSLHSSVMTQSRHSSIKNIHNPSIVSSEFSMRSSLVRSRSTDKKAAPLVLTKQQMIQSLFQRHFSLPFIKSMVQYLNKQWTLKEKQLLLQKKVKIFVQSVIQRSNWIKDLVDEFVQKEYSSFVGQDRHVITSLLFKQTVHSISDLEGVIPEIVKKIPDERVFRQEMIIQELQTKIAEIYDPKCLYSNLKIKERIALYLQEFTAKKNDLKADICSKLIPSMTFLQNMESYLSTYQKEIIKLKSQISSIQSQKNRFQSLLQKKSTFTPLNIDYDLLYEMKQKTNRAIRQDLEQNIVSYHQEKHKKNEQNIAMLEAQEHELREENDLLREEILQLKDMLNSLKNKVPQYREAGIQVYMISQAKGTEGGRGPSGGLLVRFLDNVVTPFSFSHDITASLINILSIDKVLFDYDAIRLRQGLRSFQQFVFEWFIIRTGCRKIARIFIKNFLYSLKELRTSHKRFAIFYRICGHSGYKKRNMQQDLQGVFFSTHLCWYYIMKLSLMYRKKLNDNPTGYHLFPPLQCEDIFKLPLRKIYELVQEFMRSEEMEVPQDLTQLIDHYCINQISKFKASDQNFQKETLEQIHILREINFDLIVGFIIEYIGHQRCSVLQKLLRTIDSKQKQEGNVLGYSQFQAIYRRYYKERKAKIEQIYAKLCMVNQHDMLDIQNLHPVVYIILEDQTHLRNIFDKLEPLKVLVLSQKTALMRADKKYTSINSFENFRERYYHQFYDFYNTTAFLEEVFKIVKTLVKKRLKRGMIAEEDIQRLVDYEIQPLKRSREKKKKSSAGSGSSSEEEEKEEEQRQETVVSKKMENELKDHLVQRLEEWGKIIARVPHFSSKVLTIDQIIIHNMRRKEMIEVTEFAWKTLRQILTMLGKQ